MMKSFLGLEIFTAKPIKSYLYRPTKNEETGEIEGDRTEENLLIKGSWSVVCQHLHWALSGKRRFSEHFDYKIVTDEKILSVWLGSESYKQRASDVRDEVETFNNLADLMEAPHLVLVRLGQLGYQNRAAAGALKQALGIREVSFKPTWLIEGRLPFGDGHRSYNDELGEYIANLYDVVDLGRGSESDSALDAVNSVTDVGMGVDIETPQAVELQPEKPSVSRFHANDADPIMQERRNSNHFNPKKRKKWGGGGSSSGMGF
jgi:hypothetical protein